MNLPPWPEGAANSALLIVLVSKLKGHPWGQDASLLRFSACPCSGVSSTLLSSSLHHSLYWWYALRCPRGVSPKPAFSPSPTWPYMMGTTCSPGGAGGNSSLLLFRLLGFRMAPLQPRKYPLRYDNLKALDDFWKLLGDINWLHPALDIPTSSLKYLFETLKLSPFFPLNSDSTN